MREGNLFLRFEIEILREYFVIFSRNISRRFDNDFTIKN